MNKSNNKTNGIVVLGAGLAGLAAGYRLNEMKYDFNLYEKSNFIGGHASTHKLCDFIFDDVPHVSFTKRPEIKKITGGKKMPGFLSRTPDFFWLNANTARRQ